jgi:hypothetical protein
MANYRTANGQTVNIDNLRLVNELTPAVGNMNVNARGDKISADGTIVTPKQQIMKQHYHRLEADDEFTQRKR